MDKSSYTSKERLLGAVHAYAYTKVENISLTIKTDKGTDGKHNIVDLIIAYIQNMVIYTLESTEQSLTDDTEIYNYVKN